MFIRGPSPSLRVILAVAFALGLIVADHGYDGLRGLRAALSLVVLPVHYAIHAPAHWLRTTRERFASTATLRLQTAELARENLLLKARLQQFESLEAENMRLRDLLGSSFDLGERVLIAEILEVELAPHRQQVMIDKGTSSGVFVGQPVLDANAVMGQVVRTTPFSSTVLLITDSDHALPVEIQRNGLRSIAAGTGLGHELELLYIPKNADVRVGDLLVTSGMGERFPPGYPVARIAAIRHDPDNPFTTVIAEPTARLDRSREVLLVWTLNPELQQQALTAGEPAPAGSHP